MGGLETFRARLAELGIDPETPFSYGVAPLEEHAASENQPVERWLPPLRAMVEALHAKEIPLWSPLRFSVGYVAKACGPDAEKFGALLGEVTALLLELHGRKLDTTRTEQYGVRFAADALGNPDALARALRFATSLARKEAEPGWLLQVTLPALWAAASGEPAARLAAFERSVSALEPFLDALCARGVSVGYPVATGLAALAQCPGVATHWQRWLSTASGLARALAGGQIYGAFEHGLTGIARGGLTPDEIDAGLAVAVTLADHDVNPTAALDAGFDSQLAIDVAARLAREGVDPCFVLRPGVPFFRELGWLADGGDRLVALALAIHRAGHSTRLFFEDGLFVLERLERSFGGLGGRGLELAEAMAAKGFDPGVAFRWGLPRALQLSEEAPFIAEEALALAFALTAADVDCGAALAYAVRPLVELSAGDVRQFQALRAAVQDLVSTFKRFGVNDREVLFHDVGPLAEAGTHSNAFVQLVGQLKALLEVCAAKGIDVEPLLHRALPAAAREAVGRPWVLATAFTAAERMISEGRGEQAVRLLELGLGTATRTAGEDQSVFLETLTTLERRYAQLPPEALRPASAAACALAGTDVPKLDRALELIGAHLSTSPGVSGCDPSLLEALPTLAKLADSPEALGTLMDQAVAAAATIPPAGRAAFWHGGLGAVADAVGAQPEEGARVMKALAARVEPWGDHGRWLLGSGSAVAHVLHGQAGAGAGLLTVLERLAVAAHALVDTETVLPSLLAIATTGADAGGVLERIDVLQPLLAAPANRMVLLEGLARVKPFLHRNRGAWTRLVAPTLRSHRQHAGPFLQAFAALGSRWVEDEADCEVLRELVTQLGVRALDALVSLVIPALLSGAMPGLAAHRELLFRYLREVSFHDAHVYQRYCAIQSGGGSLAEKRAQTEALTSEIAALTRNIRAGEVDEAQAASPLFGVALQHVFPPSTSATRRTYEELYRCLPDRRADTERWNPGPELAHFRATVAGGAWQFREGRAVDRSPWQALVEVLRAAPAAPDRVEPAASIGWELLREWTAGRIARDPAKSELLGRLLTRLQGSREAVSDGLETPAQLMALKALAADRLHELVEEALLAARAEDPARYDRLVRGKLAPPPRIGPGLVKGVAKTLEAARAGRLSASEARTRLEGQLQAFVLDDAAVKILFDAPPEALTATLASLPAREIELEAAKEVQRIHAELLGQDLQAMQQVLFGPEGCLEYRSSADVQTLELEVTKRRVHAMAGFTEGVCVVHDQTLWNNPDFLQAVCWGPSGTCAGGMHLLIVEDEGRKYLVLPGINPTLDLLDLVEASALLDVFTGYAWKLATQWKLAGVWVPESPSIHSNRRAIHEAILARQWPTRRTQTHAFSTSPYAYSISGVFEVPAPRG